MQAKALPKSQPPWLTFRLIEAERTMGMKTWAPLRAIGCGRALTPEAVATLLPLLVGMLARGSRERDFHCGT